MAHHSMSVVSKIVEEGFGVNYIGLCIEPLFVVFNLDVEYRWVPYFVACDNDV
jgi:hypothetical protein